MRASEQVAEFHRACDHPVRAVPTPTLPDGELELRLRLLCEEVAELMAALCGAPQSSARIAARAFERIAAVLAGMRGEADAEAVAKELADVEVVLHGTAHHCGIALDAVMDEVHRSNMSKLGPDGRPIRRDDGKVLKGPNYEPPNLARALACAA